MPHLAGHSFEICALHWNAEGCKSGSEKSNEPSRQFEGQLGNLAQAEKTVLSDSRDICETDSRASTKQQGDNRASFICPGLDKAQQGEWQQIDAQKEYRLKIHPLPQTKR